MSTRRSFIRLGLNGISLAALSSGCGLLLASERLPLTTSAKVQLRFAIASDGHYGQAGTSFDEDHRNMVNWITKSHLETPFDLVIFNGDLVHDRPDLLKDLKKHYFDKLPAAVYAVPGNHDRADVGLWKTVFGHEDNTAFEKNGIGFILMNTANPHGGYCPPNIYFLQRHLESMKALRIVFVVMHIPPCKWNDDDPYIDSPDTLALLHDYSNVKAVFHGHNHGLDSVLFSGRLPHFFDSHIGGNWGTEYRGFRIVEVQTDLQINSWQVNASMHPVLNRYAIRD